MQRPNELQEGRITLHHLQTGQSDVQSVIYRSNVGNKRRHLPNEPLTTQTKWPPRQDGRHVKMNEQPTTPAFKFFFNLRYRFLCILYYRDQGFFIFHFFLVL